MKIANRLLCLCFGPLFFLAIVNTPAMAQGVSGACLYALDGTAQQSFTISGSTVNAGCSVAVESNASQAFTMTGAETLYLQNHAQVGVVGGWQLNGNYLVDTISNQQIQPVKISSPGDPLASIQAPTSGTIVGKSHTNYDMNNRPPNNTISPGVYCGGLTIGNTNGAKFTMSPGTFIMAGGGLTINSQAVVSGTGVTVYNTSSTGWGCSGSSNYTPITVSGQANVTLSAPTSGSLSGILIFGNRTGCSTPGSCVDQINGGSSATFNGALYLKSDKLLFSGSSVTGGCLVAVADIIGINGNSNFGSTGCAINPISVSVSPQTAYLYSGQTQQFTATVTNSNNSAVTWSISPAGTGTISSSGLYTAPVGISSVQTVTVTATSQADTTKSASATVTLYPPMTISVSPTTASLYASQTKQFTATVTNANNTAVTWSISPSGLGTVSSSGLYTAPASVATTQTVTVTATSQANGALYASAAVTLLPPVAASVSPSTATLYANQTQQFTAAVVNTSNTAVTWGISPSGAGSISASGLYTAPASISTQQTVTVTATSQADTTKSSSATITLMPPIVVTISPTTATLSPGQTQQFSASLTNTGNTAVTWSISPSGVGTISASGLYTAPATVATQLTVTITATSQADGTKSASVTVSLSPSCVSSQYSYVRPIVIDHTQVPNTDQVGFPFLFNTTDPLLTSTANGGHVASPNGYDIVFSSDPAGRTLLPFEVEEYNPATGQLIAWVRIPTLSHTTDTVLYVLYGSASVTTPQQNPAAVWDTNYLGVWHVPNGTQLSLTDSTSNANNATNNGAIATSGQIDGGMQTNGSTYATIGTPGSLANLALANATFSAWVNSASGNGGILLGKDDQDNEEGWTLGITSSNNVDFAVIHQSADFDLISSKPLNSAAWSYVVVTLTGGSTQSQATIYINGQASGTRTGGNGATTDDSAQPAYLANATYGDQERSPLNGSADEFRISNILRSSDWIATEYNNQSAPSIFYSLFPESFTGVAPATATLYGSQSKQFETIGYCSSPAVTWSIPNGLGTVTDTGLYTAPATVSSQEIATITATNQSDGSTIGSANVTLLPPVSISIAPSTATIYVPNRTLQFTATVLNATNPAVTWSLSPSGAGTIDQTGLYTAPSTISVQTLTVTATSQVDPTKSASAVISLVPIVLTPTDVFIYGGYPDPITTNFPVTWSVSPSSLGTIDANGVFHTSPNVTGDYVPATVTATLKADPTSFGTTTVYLFSPGNISPTSVSLWDSQVQQFSACVANTSVTQSCDPSASTWSISPANAGAVTASGVYYAPATIPVPQTVVLTATDAANSLISFSSTITLVPPTVAVSPATITLDAGQTEQFFATVKNSSNTAVNWSISPANAGTINVSGLYQAPATITAPQTVAITGTSQAVPSISASAVLTLSPTQCAAKAYSFVRPIVIDHTRVPNTDQVNFPFLFSTTDPAFATTVNGGHVASSNGYDIVFSSDPAGVNTLDYELEKYDPATGQIIAWIRIPTLSHLGDTTLYMFYGNASISDSQQNAPGVWNNGYLGVWHLANGSVLSATDSTVNAYSGTILGASATTGIIDGAASFTGSNSNSYPEQTSHIDVGNLGAFPPQGTIEFWMNPSSLSSYPNAFTTNYNGGNNAIRFEEDSSGDFAAVIGSGSFNGYAFMSASMQPNSWYDTALTWNAAISNATGFLNGTQVFNASTSNLWPTTFPDIAIGGGYNASRDWIGSIDEVRISSVARSSDWLAAEYNSEVSPSTFFTLYAENPATIVPSSVNLYASQAQQFIAPSSGDCGTVPAVWSMPSGAPGTLSETGLYTAPPSIGSSQTVTVTANTLGSSGQSYSSVITLLPPVAISLTPPSATIYGGQTEQFSATVLNASNTNVTWTISPAGAGTISSTGVYTAPANVATPQTVYITATSVADTSQSASSTVTLIPAALPVAISVAPLNVTLYAGQTQQFTSVVNNTSDTAANWTISPSGVGTIDAAGLYTAPTTTNSQQTVTITGTSQAEANQSASATINLLPACASNGYSFVLRLSSTILRFQTRTKAIFRSCLA